MTGQRRKVVLLCTALNEAGGTSRHMAKIYHALDKERFSPVIVFSSTQKDLLLDFFRSEGCLEQDLYVVPVLFRDLIGTWGALRRIWARIKPDIIHSFFLHSDILSVLTTLCHPSVRRVSSVEGKFVWDDVNGVGRCKHLCYRIFNRLIRNCFVKTITVSSALRDEVIQEGAVPGKVVAIPVGLPIIPEDRLTVREHSGVVVGCMSRFSQDKGVDLFLKAVVHLKGLLNVRFIVAGSGEEEANLKALAGNLGIMDRVHFQGWVKDVNAFLNGIDIFVMPSRREGCPLALIEAMMHKKAIAVFDAPGVNEVVKDQETALIASGFDTEQLSRNIGVLIKDDALRSRLGDKARMVALEKYSTQNEIRLLQDVY